MRLVVLFCLILAALVAISMAVDFDAVARWAAGHQRGFQNQMAGAVRALRTGDPGALFTLLFAAASYGFVHAVGPGHGKALIGGVGLGSSVSTARLLVISLVSSLLQAFWAILLIYGGFALVEISARRMTTLAEDVLAPASYIAIASIGVILVWRGGRSLWREREALGLQKADHDHDHDHCGCHAHGPAPNDVAQLTSFRDAFVLVASIAIRPCTGAIFLLVIAWQMDIRTAGAAAVIVMGLGTAVFTSLVAVSTVTARRMSLVPVAKLLVVSQVLPVLQILAGGLIVWGSLTMLELAG
ncbi:unnamed protein product [Chrysoparadoxa australica]